MFLGNIKIKEQFLGDTPIKSIWLGNTQVWTIDSEYTYEIKKVSVYYLPTSNGTSVLPTGSNYANIIGEINIYKNGTLVDSKASMPLDITTTSPYVIIKENKIYFDINTYGTTNMSTLSNPFNITVNTSFSGATGASTTVSVTPNRIASQDVIETVCKGTTSVPFLEFSETTFTLTNKNVNTTKTTYTSGKYTTSTSNTNGYLYKLNKSTGAYTLLGSLEPNGNITVSTAPVNQGSCPIIHMYRLSYTNAVTGIDHHIYMMQKCRNNTSGLQLYLDNTKLEDEDYIESSGYFYLANNGHTSTTTYTWSCNNSRISVTQTNGVFYIEATSSESGILTIRDNFGNTCTLTIN